VELDSLPASFVNLKLVTQSQSKATIV